MFNNSSKMLFFFIMILSSLITISSNSWIGAWMGLEINLLSFIPLMINTSNMMSTEASLKYFLTQALASSIFLFSLILSMLKFNFFFQMNSESLYLNIMIMSSLLLKSGTAPFHFWFPEVMEGITWINALMLMTWQKIAPLTLMSYLNINNFIFLFIILSTIIGAIGGLNQTSLKKIMAFSSINHLGWILTAMMFSNNLWISYFLFYCMLSSTLIIMFYMFNINHFNQLSSLFINSKTMKFFMFLNFLSLGGLPPFLGFFPKWIVISNLVTQNQLLLMIIMVTFSLITLFFYTRMCYTTFMINNFKMNWNYTMINNNNKLMYLYMSFSFISLFGLLMTPYLFNYL